jgi:phage gp29-like protein
MATFTERVLSAVAGFIRPDVPSSNGNVDGYDPTLTARSSETAGITRSGSDRIAAPPQSEKWPSILGPAMTPEVVDRAVRQAHRGYMQRYCDLLSEQRSKVTHLQGVLSVREKAIASKPWVIVPKSTGKKGTDKEAARVADFVRMRLGEIPKFRARLQHLAGGIYFGRSAVETEFVRDSRGIAVKALHVIHPRRLSYAGLDWSLRLYDESGNANNPALGTYPGVDIFSEYPDRFVVHEPTTVGAESPTRQGIGMTLVWCLLFWLWTTRDWMQFAELHGRPWRVGVWERGLSVNASKEDIAALERAVQEISGATGVALPRGADLRLLTPANAGATHEKLRTAFNAEISKVVLGQTGTTELGDTGSYAAVKVHDLVRGDVLQDDGAALAETITRQLVYTLVRKQFGRATADALCPEFLIVTQPDEALDFEFSRFKDLTDRGVAFDADEARERYTRLGKPEGSATLVRPIGEMQKVGLGPVTSNEDAAAQKEEAKPAPVKPAASQDNADDGADPAADPNAQD